MRHSPLPRAATGGRPLLAVILAAGRGRRAGGRAKHLFRLRGQTLIDRQLELLRRLGLDAIIITGAHTLPGQPGRRHNPAWRSGRGSSIRLATRHVLASRIRPAALLFLAADQWLSDPEPLEILCRTWLEDPRRAVGCSHDGRPGIPFIVPPGVWPRLLRLTGDRGVAAILRGDALTMTAACKAPVDVDSLTVLRGLRSRTDHRHVSRPSGSL